MEAPRAGVVLDANAVIALLRAEQAAPRVAQLLRDRPSRMSAVNAAETVDVLVRRYRWPADDVVARVEQLLSGVVVPVSASVDVATQVGELRARHFDRRARRLSLADCFVLATVEEGDAIVTTDADLAAVARDEGIEVELASG